MAQRRNTGDAHGEGRTARRTSSERSSTRKRRDVHGGASGQYDESARPDARRVSSAAGEGARGAVGARELPKMRYTSDEQRARRAQAYRRARQRRRTRLLGLGIVGVALIGVLLFALGRCAAGCASKKSDPKYVELQEQTVEDSKATETSKEATKPVQIDLVMIGDILQHAGVYMSGFYDDGSRNYDHIFAHIADQLAGADIKVVNQETLLGGESFEFSGYPTFNGPQEMGDAEVKAGFNVILRATNHAMDRGYEGLSSELSYWHTNHPEVAVIGAVDPNDASASIDDVYVFEKDGFKVALLNYTYDLNGFEDPQGVISTLDEEHVRKTVSAAHEMADMVVVFPHWGEEYNLVPVQSQYDMANIFMECGADVIIGGHPHVIEPVEILSAPDGRKVPCFWSVGNFVSTQVENMNLIGGVARVTLLKDADGACSVTACSFVPTVTHKGVGTNMTTYLLRDYTDELAYSNYLEYNGTDNTSLTVAWANEFCSEVLGSGFDATSAQIVFSADELKASQPQQQKADVAEDVGEPDTIEAEEELDEAA